MASVKPRQPGKGKKDPGEEDKNPDANRKKKTEGTVSLHYERGKDDQN